MQFKDNDFLWEILKTDPNYVILLVRYAEMLKNIQNPFLGHIMNLKIESGMGVYHPNESSSSMFFIRHLPHQLSGTLLDMGCGCGVIGMYLKKKNYDLDVVLCDVDDKAIYVAEKNVINNNLDIKVKKSNIFRSLDQNEKFDHIIFNIPLFNKKFDSDNPSNTQVIHAEVPLSDFGMKIFNEFFEEYPKYLNDHGKCYIAVSNISGQDTIEKLQNSEKAKILFLEYNTETNMSMAFIELTK